MDLQKGGSAGLWRKIVIGLDHKTGPHTKEAWIGKIRLVVEQGFDLSWVQVTTSAECKKVSRYSLFREGAVNAARKEPIEALINL
jgi:hypothetical protein